MVKRADIFSQLNPDCLAKSKTQRYKSTVTALRGFVS